MKRLLGGAFELMHMAGVALLLVFGMPEGPGQIFAIAASDSGAMAATGASVNKFSLGSFGLSLTETTFWVVLVYGFVMNLNNFGIDQNFVQRYHAAKSDRDAVMSV